MHRVRPVISSVFMLVFVDYLSDDKQRLPYLFRRGTVLQSMLVDQSLLSDCHHNALVGCATSRGLIRMR